jgi:hypothetical protein
VHVLVGIASLALIALLLVEFFVVFLLPRRVKRDPRIARVVLRLFWRPWRAIARRLPRGSAETMLGIYGPFGLLAILATLSVGVIIGYAGLQWADSTRLSGSHAAGFGEDLYLSAGVFFSASTPFLPHGSLGRALQVIEAATGFAFLAIAIGYLPALFQAFSRRETAVSRLDPRAGSPPSPGALLQSAARRGGWRELDTYLQEWETWTAELMETHLSYPILGYFRSQHVGQNWLAALTTVVDACAYALAYGREADTGAAELTFRIGRHALADLADAFAPDWDRRAPAGAPPRLTPEGLIELRERLTGSGLHCEGGPEADAHLERLRASYEPYAQAIARQLALALPDWLPEDVEHYWRTAARADRSLRGGLLS